MPARKILLILLGAWIACQVMSVLHPAMTGPTGDGFARGLNLLALFLVWQSAAVLFAVGLLAVRLMRADELSSAMRWLGQGPLLLEAVGIGGLVLFFTFAG